MPGEPLAELKQFLRAVVWVNGMGCAPQVSSGMKFVEPRKGFKGLGM